VISLALLINEQKPILHALFFLFFPFSPLVDPAQLCVPNQIPCRRSLITYISQFLRLSHPSFLHSTHTQLSSVDQNIQVPIDERAGTHQLSKAVLHNLEWLHKMTRDSRLKLTEKQRITLGQYKVSIHIKFNITYKRKGLLKTNIYFIFIVVSANCAKGMVGKETNNN
jgi:hypothetical protein